MSNHRWTNKELEAINDLDFALIVLSERQHQLSNYYSPLYTKLSEAKMAIAEAKVAAEQRKFEVNTPSGTLVVYAKHEGADLASDYPGVYVDLKTDVGEKVILACVEHDSSAGDLLGTLYAKEASEEPTTIEHYDFDAKTYGKEEVE